MTVSKRYTRKPKYEIVSTQLPSGDFSVLDIGARDRVLQKYLSPTCRYFSADQVEGHDYSINLENPLAFGNDQFDYVVALDVLEHVENMHAAFVELCRIARCGVVIGLPNYSSLYRRTAYLFTGRLATGKYDLLVNHQGDRHRWLTVYPQMQAFIEELGQHAGFSLTEQVEQIEHGMRGIPGKIIGDLLELILNHIPDRRGLFTERCIYYLSRMPE